MTTENVMDMLLCAAENDLQQKFKASILTTQMISGEIMHIIVISYIYFYT